MALATLALSLSSQAQTEQPPSTTLVDPAAIAFNRFSFDTTQQWIAFQDTLPTVNPASVWGDNTQRAQWRREVENNIKTSSSSQVLEMLKSSESVYQQKPSDETLFKWAYACWYVGKVRPEILPQSQSATPGYNTFNVASLSLLLKSASFLFDSHLKESYDLARLRFFYAARLLHQKNTALLGLRVYKANPQDEFNAYFLVWLGNGDFLPTKDVSIPIHIATHWVKEKKKNPDYIWVASSALGDEAIGSNSVSCAAVAIEGFEWFLTLGKDEREESARAWITDLKKFFPNAAKQKGQTK